MAGEFLVDIKKEFGEGDKESIKVAELRRLEQESKIMEEFVQEFRRAACYNLKNLELFKRKNLV